MRSWLPAIVLALCPIALSPAFAQPAAVETIAALHEWQAKEARLFAVGWRLTAGNAAYCDEARPALGLLLHDALSYDDPAAVREAFGLRGDIAVQAVAPGSPADSAGMRANAALASVNDQDLATRYPPTSPAWQRVAAIHDAIDRQAALAAPVSIGWVDPTGATNIARINPIPTCPSRFELTGSGERAIAEGQRVLIGAEFPGFAYPEAEFAAAIAHELAHNLLRHRDWLDVKGRRQSHIRLTEREADRLMPWLLANAGYPPEAAARFMRRWGPGNDGGLFRKRTHDGWDERLHFIEAELPLIASSIAETGGADWRTRFRRQLP